jgi:hypothetical protein
MSDNWDPSSPDFYYSQYKEAVSDNLITGMVYGAYIVVYVTSAYVLLKKPGFTSSPPRMFMFGITTFIFALGIIALVLSTVLGCRLMKAILMNSDLDSSFLVSSAVWATMTRLMYILSDIICSWRTVVLWNRDKRVIAILLFFILGSTVAAVLDLYFSLIPVFGAANRSIEDPGKVGERALLFVVLPTLATNLLSTGLIAWKAWERRGPVKIHLSDGGGSVRVDRVFALLIESGFIYCCIWVLYAISVFGVFLDPGFIAMAGVAGLYPTLIIILVSTQMSPVEHYSSKMRVPALGLPRDSSISQNVISIHRESTSDSYIQAPSMVFKKSSDEERMPLAASFGR